MVIIKSNGIGDQSSNPQVFAFHLALMPLGKAWIYVPPLWENNNREN